MTNKAGVFPPKNLYLIFSVASVLVPVCNLTICAGFLFEFLIFHNVLSGNTKAKSSEAATATATATATLRHPANASVVEQWVLLATLIELILRAAGEVPRLVRALMAGTQCSWAGFHTR